MTAQTHVTAVKQHLARHTHRATKQLLLKHKLLVHGTTLAFIVLSLVAEGSVKPADWGFVALSILCEVS